MIIRDVYFTSMRPQADGASITVHMAFVDVEQAHETGYQRTMPPEEFGRFIHGLLSVIDSHRGDCVRLRMSDDGLITGIGHATEDRWFDPRPADEAIALTVRASRDYQSALSHINNSRARYGGQPLNPVAAGWLDVDVFDHARDLGWRP
jgi:hypothetical protein